MLCSSITHESNDVKIDVIVTLNKRNSFRYLI